MIRLCKALFAVVTFVVLNLAFPAYAFADGYNLTVLGPLGGNSDVAISISENGKVAGIASSPQDQIGNHGFRYNGQGPLQDLGTLGGLSSSGLGINNAGQVTGFAEKSDGSARAFLFDGDGPLQDLGTLGGGSSVGFGINNSGQITGRYFTGNGGEARAFLYDGSTMVDIGALRDGEDSFGYAINDAGQITGQSGSRAFRYNGQGSLQDLGTLGGTYSRGDAINNLGQVAGRSTLADETFSQAFLSNAAGTSLLDLGTLPRSYGDYGLGINDLGHVVGASHFASSESHAFFFDGERMRDLNDLILNNPGYVMTYAWDINNAGQIVGEAGRFAVLLTPVTAEPVPEPTTIMLLGTGLAGAGWLRRRRQRKAEG